MIAEAVLLHGDDGGGGGGGFNNEKVEGFGDFTNKRRVQNPGWFYLFQYIFICEIKMSIHEFRCWIIWLCLLLILVVVHTYIAMWNATTLMWFELLNLIMVGKFLSSVFSLVEVVFYFTFSVELLFFFFAVYFEGEIWEKRSNSWVLQIVITVQRIFVLE